MLTTSFVESTRPSSSAWFSTISFASPVKPLAADLALSPYANLCIATEALIISFALSSPAMLTFANSSFSCKVRVNSKLYLQPLYFLANSRSILPSSMELIKSPRNVRISASTSWSVNITCPSSWSV